MALFGFRTRTPERDRDTDRDRIDRLIALVRQLQQEAGAERSGLQNRYEQAQNSAAFTLDAMENGEGGDLAAQADSLERTMQHYRRRIAALEKQIAFMGGLESEIGDFREDLTKAPPEAD